MNSTPKKMGTLLFERTRGAIVSNNYAKMVESEKNNNKLYQAESSHEVLKNINTSLQYDVNRERTITHRSAREKASKEQAFKYIISSIVFESLMFDDDFKEDNVDIINKAINHAIDCCNITFDKDCAASCTTNPLHNDIKDIVNNAVSIYSKYNNALVKDGLTNPDGILEFDDTDDGRLNIDKNRSKLNVYDIIDEVRNKTTMAIIDEQETADYNSVVLNTMSEDVDDATNNDDIVNVIDDAGVIDIAANESTSYIHDFYQKNILRKPNAKTSNIKTPFGIILESVLNETISVNSKHDVLDTDSSNEMEDQYDSGIGVSVEDVETVEKKIIDYDKYENENSYTKSITTPHDLDMDAVMAESLIIYSTLEALNTMRLMSDVTTDTILSIVNKYISK